jgi:hypothetical protein
MHWTEMLVTGGILILLLSGCLPPPDKSMKSLDSKPTRALEDSLVVDRQDAGDRWLDADRIESALQKQTEATDRSSQAFWDHYHDLIALQKLADILIELPNQDRMEIRASKLKEFPKAQFPVPDMKEHLPSRRVTHVPLGLVVVVMPDTFTAEQGKPSQLELMRNIDKLLRNAGVRRRVFETMGNGRFYKLDSSETN